MTDSSLDTPPAAEPVDALPKRADGSPDFDRVMADASVELDEGPDAAALAEAAAARPRPGGAGEGVQVVMQCVVYEDPAVPHSRFVNPMRSKTLRMFELKHGYAQPDNIDDIHWLIWHSLGRPGRNGERPAQPAIGDAEDPVFREWLDSVECLAAKNVTRGKAV